NLYPVPAVNVLNMSIYSEKAMTQGNLSIVGIDGATKYSQMLNLNVGANTIQVPVSELSAGTYIIRILGNGAEPIQKLFVKN
ncbi:MAG: T9SS type A sorting domain-containing protein, partial [Bacteroidota bacterium]|nr:T9SS type A sorting domain-containing protein [Bacteroidota bacterium]